MESRYHAASSLAFLMGLSICCLCLAQDSTVDYLEAHNAARAEVGVDPMKWDQGLANYAYRYAKSRSYDCTLFHSGGPYGENIYVGHGDGYSSATDAVRWWYNEKAYYNYDTDKCVGMGSCLHYTQMVWRHSLHLGCARVQCVNGSFFISCNYDPPGNFLGDRPY